jgi:DNA repair protein RadA/Sms
MSSLANVPLPAETVYFGEISLSGAIRPAGHTGTRLKEAQKLGFRTAVIPTAGDLDVGDLKLQVKRHAQLQNIAGAFMKSIA